MLSLTRSSSLARTFARASPTSTLFRSVVASSWCSITVYPICTIVRAGRPGVEQVATWYVVSPAQRCHHPVKSSRDRSTCALHRPSCCPRPVSSATNHCTRKASLCDNDRRLWMAHVLTVGFFFFCLNSCVHFPELRACAVVRKELQQSAVCEYFERRDNMACCSVEA